MENQKRIIEVNGVKLEIDLSTARVVEEYRVGDPVKVLTKDYSGYKSCPGVIVGFDPFENLPTIIIAVLKVEYSAAKFEYVYFNAQTENVEVCPATREGEILINRAEILSIMDKEIEKKKLEASELELRKENFLRWFGKYFPNETAAAEAAVN